MASASENIDFPVSRAQAKKAISDLIQKEGLEKITSSKIRAHLKSVFDVEFDNFKKDVDLLTKQVIENADHDSDSDNDDIAPPPKSASPVAEPTKTVAAANDSDSDSSDPGVASSDRARPVKKKAAKRKAPISSNLVEDDVDLMSAVKSRQRAAAKQANSIIKKTGVRQGKKKDADAPKKDNSGKFGKMTKLCLISDELQQITGKKFMKRCDVVKETWAYVRKYDLFDPKDKRFAICDDTLTSIFKKKRFRIFSMMKDMAKHVMDPELLGGDVWKEAEAEKERLIKQWKARQEAEARGEVAGGSGDVADEEEEEDEDEGESRDGPDTEGNGTDGEPAQKRTAGELAADSDSDPADDDEDDSDMVSD